MSQRTFKITLTKPQLMALAAAIGERVVTLEDEELWQERAVLNRAWDRIRMGWHSK